MRASIDCLSVLIFYSGLLKEYRYVGFLYTLFGPSIKQRYHYNFLKCVAGAI